MISWDLWNDNHDMHPPDESIDGANDAQADNHDDDGIDHIEKDLLHGAHASLMMKLGTYMVMP